MEYTNYDEILNYYMDLYKDNPDIEDFLMQNDLPVPYKDLKIFPVKISMNIFFQSFASCLVLQQHRIADAEVLRLKYLDFLFYVNKVKGIDNTLYSLYLKELLYICLRLPRTIKNENNEDIPTIDFVYSNNNHLIRIYNKTYNAEDFENIRRIICKQNLIELPDVKSSPDIEKKYEEYIAYLKKIGKIKTGNFEDLSLCLMSELGYTKEEVKNLTIRTFYSLLERVGFIMDSKILRLLSPNLEKKDIDKIPNWTDKIVRKTHLEEMSSSVQDMEKKISGTN